LEEGSYGWRVRDAEGNTPNRMAMASYRASFGRVQAGVQQFGGNVRGTGQIDGSIAVAGGGVFFGNRIDDAFAVVNAGVPDVAVQYENRPIGVTNKSGMLLVPYLSSYQKNKISIDPKNLPLDADIPKTREVVVPADRSGVVVDFGVTEAPKAALVTFVETNGKPLKVASQVRLEAAEQSFVVGCDGQAYIRGLTTHNIATIYSPEGDSCRAEFDYTPQSGEQVKISNVVCQ
jgi:outer membrane usher protein